MKGPYGFVACSTREGQRSFVSVIKRNKAFRRRHPGRGFAVGDSHTLLPRLSRSPRSAAKIGGREVDGIERAFVGLAVMSFVALMASLMLLAIF
jgi:hypothetical protein